MNEIEVKILETNSEEIRSKLKKLGARKIFDGQLTAVTFDFPDSRIHNAKQLLRVRNVGDQAELCFKGKKQDHKLKIQEEIEVNTDNFEGIIKILERIGLTATHHKSKHRESYMLGNVRFEIDTDPPIPAYLEIEAPSEADVIRYVKLLGFSMEQTSNMTGAELHEYYKTYQTRQLHSDRG